MTSLRPAPRRGAIAACSVLLSTTLALMALAGAPATAEPSADPSGPTAQEVAAEQALETVAAALGPGEDDAGPADPASNAAEAHQDLSSGLRDLASLQQHLSPADQKVAARLLARPTDDESSCIETDYACFGDTVSVFTECNATICVHYSKTGAQRVPAENDGAGGSWAGTTGGAPDYVEVTLATLARVAQRYLAAGYRAPVADGGTDGTSQLDVYLADIGGSFNPVYGYCWTDEVVYQHVAVAPYCVLDNDYRAGQFPSGRPIDNLRVTVAHEYFHAVQFAYDFYDDLWWMEATATWAEEVLYDGVNDNRQYLSEGPLRQPTISLDSSYGIRPYATWIWVQYLTQRFPRTEGGMPVIIRHIWEKMAHQGDGARGMYSIKAIRSAIADRGSDFTTEFATFTSWNRRPAGFYAEGGAYRPAAVSASYRVGPGSTRRSVRFQLDHLSAAHVRFRSAFRGRKFLRIAVNLNSRSAGGFAYVLFKPSGGASRRIRVPLNVYGNGSIKVRFGGSVDWVEVNAVNASTYYDNCETRARWRRPEFTCGGYARHDDVVQQIDVRAVNR